MGQVFDGPALIASALIGLALFFIRLAVGGVKGEDRTAIVRSLEVGLLAFAGGFLARSFISLILGLGKDSPAIVMAASWVFFPWAGLVNTVASVLPPHRLLVDHDALLWLALGVGSFIGAVDGYWRIHPWVGIGFLSFLLDVTWGLPANVNACLLHVWNLFAAQHVLEPRTGAHRFLGGFRVKHDFAFTQGNAMSNLSDAPRGPVFRHERTHVWQNRAFGPLFFYSYIGWMLVMLFFGVIAAGVKKVGLDKAIEGYCYWNNPWEAWGYLVGAGPRTGRAPLIWSDGAVLGASIPYFLAFVALAVVLVVGLLG